MKSFKIVKFQHGNTALHEAAWKGFSHTVQVLCKAKANFYIKNRGGFAPLHLCCQNGHNETCRVLLLNGCKPDIKNNVRNKTIPFFFRITIFSMGTLLFIRPRGTATPGWSEYWSARGVMHPNKTRWALMEKSAGNNKYLLRANRPQNSFRRSARFLTGLARSWCSYIKM